MRNSREIAIKALTSNSLISLSNQQNAQLVNPDFDINLVEIGMDSLGRMELSIWLEIELGLTVPLSEIERISTLSALAALIDAHLSSGK